MIRVTDTTSPRYAAVSARLQKVAKHGRENAASDCLKSVTFKPSAKVECMSRLQL